MKKGAVYARYSSDKQTGESVQVQIDKCRDYCEQQNILVCEVFVDEAKSGTTEGGREEYARMLEMAGDSFFDVIIAYKYDRIGRSFLETLRSIGDLERLYDVKVCSATEPNEPLVRNILLSVAEDFSRQLSGRVVDSMSSNAERGFHCGGVAPYGYIGVKVADPSGRTDRKGSPIQHVVFELHPEQAPVAHRIFRAYGDGVSMKKIAASLNDEGIASPGGNTWDMSAVRYILYNETYRGWRIWNKTKKVRKPDGKKTYRHRPRKEWKIMKDAHPPIVDDDLWEAVEKTKQRRDGFRAGNTRKGGEKGAFSKYLLTGFLKCGQCGANYIAQISGGERAGQYAYYRCGYRQRRGESVCSNHTSLPMPRIEGAVIDLLQDEILTKQTVDVFVEDVLKRYKEQLRDPGQDELKKTVKELHKAERELIHLVQAIKATGISETLKTELERVEKRKASLEQTRQQLEQTRATKPTVPNKAAVLAALDGFRGLLESGTLQERKTVLEAHIEEIVVQPEGEVILKANPTGLLPLPDCSFDWCRGRGSNPYDLAAKGF